MELRVLVLVALCFVCAKGLMCWWGSVTLDYVTVESAAGCG